MIAMPKKREDLIAYRYEQLVNEVKENVKEFTNDIMDSIHDAIEQYIIKIDDKSVKTSESSIFYRIKLDLLESISNGNDSDVEIISADEYDIPVNMIGIDYVDIDKTSAEIVDVLHTLTPKEADIIYKCFIEGRTFIDVGKSYNLSNNRISQIASKALRKLRHPGRSRVLKKMLCYYFDTSISNINGIEFIIERYKLLPKVRQYINHNIDTVTEDDIKSYFLKLFGKYARYMTHTEESLLAYLHKRNDVESPVSVELKVLKSKFDQKYMKIASYKHYLYRIYLKPISKYIKSLPENTEEDKEFKLSRLEMCLIKFDCIISGDLNDNKAILKNLIRSFNIDVSYTNFSNVSVKYLNSVLPIGVLNEINENVIKESGLDGIVSVENVPTYAVFRLLDKKYISKYFGFSVSSCIFNLIEYNEKIPVATYDSDKILSDKEVSTINKIVKVKEKDILNNIKKRKEEEILRKKKAKEEEEKKERRRKEEEERKRKEREETYNSELRRITFYQDKFIEEKNELRKSIDSGKLAKDANTIYKYIEMVAEYAANGCSFSAYSYLLATSGDYPMRVINKILSYLENDYLKEFDLYDIDNNMPNERMNIIYKTFKNLSVRSRISNRVDSHYWIIIDTLTVIYEFFNCY